LQKKKGKGIQATYATFILALCTRFFGLKRLYLASSLGGGLMANDHSLP